jgi:hypothetical protein
LLDNPLSIDLWIHIGLSIKDFALIFDAVQNFFFAQIGIQGIASQQVMRRAVRYFSESGNWFYCPD